MVKASDFGARGPRFESDRRTLVFFRKTTKLVISFFKPYLGQFLSYRDVQYLILILLKNHFDLLKCIFTLGVTVSQIYCKICVLLFLPQTLAQGHGSTFLCVREGKKSKNDKKTLFEKDLPLVGFEPGSPN